MPKKRKEKVKKRPCPLVWTKVCVLKFQVQIEIAFEWNTQNGTVSEARSLKRVKLKYKDLKVGTFT